MLLLTVLLDDLVANFALSRVSVALYGVEVGILYPDLLLAVRAYHGLWFLFL